MVDMENGDQHSPGSHIANSPRN